VERSDTPWTSRAEQGRVLRIPIKHGEGCYYADPATLDALQANGQILLRYSTPDGRIREEANPNGSLLNVAGIMNPRGNVFGLMPHPEHAVEPRLGGEDGRRILESLVETLLAAPARSFPGREPQAAPPVSPR
jgi:phosphoribosylformylglycinamidine synthase